MIWFRTFSSRFDKYYSFLFWTAIAVNILFTIIKANIIYFYFIPLECVFMSYLFVSVEFQFHNKNTICVVYCLYQLYCVCVSMYNRILLNSIVSFIVFFIWKICYRFSHRLNWVRQKWLLCYSISNASVKLFSDLVSEMSSRSGQISLSCHKIDSSEMKTSRAR